MTPAEYKVSSTCHYLLSWRLITPVLSCSHILIQFFMSLLFKNWHWSSRSLSSSLGDATFVGGKITYYWCKCVQAVRGHFHCIWKKKITPPWDEDGKERQTERPDVSFSDSSSCEQGRCSGTLELQVVGRFNRHWHVAGVSERGDGFWQDGH